MIPSTRQSAKFIKLVRKLRPMLGASAIVDAESVAVAILERLWHATASSAIRGDIGRFEDEVIAELVGWMGDSSELVAMLVDCGWLDVSTEHRLLVHDWHDHAPNHVKGNVTKLGGFLTGLGPALGPSPWGPALEAQPQGIGPPSLAKPSLTKPSLTNAASLLAASGEEGFFDEVRKLARDLKAAARVLEPDFVWQVCCVGYAFDRGLVGDWVNRFRTGNIAKPKRYLESALKAECEKRGITWEDAAEVFKPVIKQPEPAEATA